MPSSPVPRTLYSPTQVPVVSEAFLFAQERLPQELITPRARPAICGRRSGARGDPELRPGCRDCRRKRIYDPPEAFSSQGYK